MSDAQRKRKADGDDDDAQTPSNTLAVWVKHGDAIKMLQCGESGPDIKSNISAAVCAHFSVAQDSFVLTTSKYELLDASSKDLLSSSRESPLVVHLIEVGSELCGVCWYVVWLLHV